MHLYVPMQHSSVNPAFKIRYDLDYDLVTLFNTVVLYYRGLDLTGTLHAK